jgi:hypothetical protein
LFVCTFGEKGSGCHVDFWRMRVGLVQPGLYPVGIGLGQLSDIGKGTCIGAGKVLVGLRVD